MESPIWLYSKVQAQDDENVEEIIKENFMNVYTEDSSLQKARAFIAERKEILDAQTAEHGFTDLFTKDFRLQFMIGVLLNFLNQMTGINFLILYSTKIFTGLNIENPETYTSIMSFLNFLSGIIITLLASCVGRKTALVSGLLGQSMAYFFFLVGFTLKNQILVIGGTFLYIFCFAFSLGATNYPYLAEILPPIGLSICGVAQWVIGMLVAKFALPIIETFGIFTTFFVFMAISGIGCVLLAGYGVDTTNKNNTEIKNLFLTKKFLD